MTVSAAPTPPRIAVIGAGPMGLAVAYQLTLEGCRPIVFEADDRLGGMAASFDFAGVTLERYYHFHCLSDQDFFTLLAEIHLDSLMRWRNTSMGFFLDGRLYPWGSARAVLSLRRLPLLSRIRYLLHAARCLTLRDWRHLDAIKATDWLHQWLGEKAYLLLWKKLFAYKFYQFSDQISAAWIWSRIRRIGRSRRWLKEKLGYIEGGSELWITAVAKRIVERGGEIRLSTPVGAIQRVTPSPAGVEAASQREMRFNQAADDSGPVTITTPSGSEQFDAVISTVPLPLVAPMLRNGGHDPAQITVYEAQKSVACACVVIQTTMPVTKHFWTNVNDSRFSIPGIIEMSNLRPLNPHITYIPFYMPADHPDYKRPDQAFIADAMACLKAINPTLSDAQIIASHCSRYRYAQPVCGPNFLDTLPPLNPFPNVWIADTTVYYPEDRGISESIGFGRQLAKRAAARCQVGWERPRIESIASMKATG
ncbi:MAG: NAD(P)/FAD-dependent oxidoreductase [Cyanobacteriota bacterium]|nr:NAD(P)/FAD-dependent oxidoreductase [Cyanobacteriota bacterium]